MPTPDSPLLSTPHHELLHRFVEICDDYAIFLLDPAGHIITWNKGAERIKGYTTSDIVGKHFSIFYTDIATKENFPNFELETAKKEGRFEDEGWRVRKDGQIFWANVIITAIYDVHQQLIGFGKITRDLTKRKQTDDEAIFLSNHDVLTTLYNRNAFNLKLKTAIDNSLINKTSTAVILIDLDNFKMVNDTFGHQIGDQLLIAVASKLTASVRREDFVARLGGDEFAIVISDIKSDIEIIEFAENLTQRFQKPFELNGNNFHATVSVGIAVSPTAGLDETTLIKNADIALYAVKEHGRNHYQIFSQKINTHFNLRNQISTFIPHAIENQELYLAYQPQINLADRKIAGFEVLLRWHHPTLGLIMPNEFIPIAEKNGCIVQIGEWVFETAFTHYMQWHNDKLIAETTKLAINVSIKQLQKSNFFIRFKRLLEKTGMIVTNLVFELAEKAVITNIKEVNTAMHKLHELGVSLSIDNFGAGYSSLSRLQHLPVSSLKIDKSFIELLDKDPKDAAIVQSILDLGVSLGLDVIPEGVENEKQLALLLKYNCNVAQGYYFGSRPLTQHEMTNLLRETD